MTSHPSKGSKDFRGDFMVIAMDPGTPKAQFYVIIVRDPEKTKINHHVDLRTLKKEDFMTISIDNLVGYWLQRHPRETWPPGKFFWGDPGDEEVIN